MKTRTPTNYTGMQLITARGRPDRSCAETNEPCTEREQTGHFYYSDECNLFVQYQNGENKCTLERLYHAAASSICSEVTVVSLVPLDSGFQPGAAGERTRVRRDQADYLGPTSGRRERRDRAFGPGRVSVCQVSSFSVSS